MRRENPGKFDISKTEAVLWDLDETLYSRRQAARLTYPGMFQAFLYPGKSHSQLEEAADFMMAKVPRHNMVSPEAFAQLTEKYPPEIPFDLDACLKYYYENMYKLAKPTSDALAVLKKLKTLGVKTAIVTNIPKHRVADQRRKIQALGMESLFDHIIISGELDIHKPDRRIFDYAADLLGVANEKCLFIGDDLQSDVVGARNAQMEVLWLDHWWEDNPFADDPLVHRVHSVAEYFDF